MKPVFSTVLVDLDGNEFSDQIAMQANGYFAKLAEHQRDLDRVRAPKQTMLTLGAAARHALCSNFNDERDLSGEDKFERGMLAHRIRADGCDCSVEEIATIKKLIGKLYGPEVVVAAWPLLDPSVKDKKKK